MNPTVSVVIPVRNRAGLVVRALDSVLAQSYRPLQLIVVDNGSTDDSLKTIEEWAARHHEPEFEIEILTEPEPGASAARNRGLAAVNGEFTLFFDSDDEMHPDLVESAVKAIKNADLVYWKAEVVGLDGKRYVKPFHTDNLLRRHFYNSILSTQTYMARTTLFREVGGWNQNAKVWNDWEIGIRIGMTDPKAIALPHVLASIHAQQESITGTAFSHRVGDWEQTLDIVENTIRNARIDLHTRKQMLLMTEYRRVILASLYAREGEVGAAKQLLGKALASPILSKARRRLLRLIYHYTRFGGRAAYYLWR